MEHARQLQQVKRNEAVAAAAAAVMQQKKQPEQYFRGDGKKKLPLP